MAKRIVEHELLNNGVSQSKISEARHKVDATQHVTTTAAYLNTLLSITGIINVSLGVTSATFGGDYYEDLEDFYSNVYEMMTSNEIRDNTPSSDICPVDVPHYKNEYSLR